MYPQIEGMKMHLSETVAALLLTRAINIWQFLRVQFYFLLQQIINWQINIWTKNEIIDLCLQKE